VVLHAEDYEMSRSSQLNRTRTLEMIFARHLKLFTKLGMAVLVLGALASSGNAQTVYQGKFALPFEPHWGGATLPAGDYTFTLVSASSPYTLYIHGQAGNAIIKASTADEKVVSGHAQLNLVDIADVQNVETFEAPELGMTFSYWTPKQKNMGRKEARRKTMPQAAPASQVSEYKTTSIEVRSAGR
jgi:hypothetical protein